MKAKMQMRGVAIRLRRTLAYWKTLETLYSDKVHRLHVASNTFRIVEQEAWNAGIDLRARHAFGSHGMVLSEPLDITEAKKLAARLRWWELAPQALADAKILRTDIQYVADVAKALEALICRGNEWKGTHVVFEVSTQDDDREMEALCDMADRYADSLDEQPSQ